MASGNPALSENIFLNESRSATRSGVMTVNGAVVKSGVLGAILLAAGGVAWSLVHAPTDGGYAIDTNYRLLFGVGAPILGFVVALVTCFVPKVSPVTAPIYAALEGLFLGSVSAFANARYDGIVTQAGLATVSVLLAMLFLYATGVVRATARFRAGVMAATMGVCLLMLANFVLYLCGVELGLRGAGMLGIGFSVFVIVIAALNLVLDFDAIERGARAGAPKYMEWYSAFGLMVTLVWLYLEVLRLLINLQNSRN